MKPSSFLIFDASAGSGKTFSLVKEYLRVLFSSNSKHPFKNILAITFTRKAANEMQTRLLERLYELATCDLDKLNEILSELQLDVTPELTRISRSLYEKILRSDAPVRKPF